MPRPALFQLYLVLLAAGLRAKLNQRADFMIMAGAAMLTQTMGYIFLWAVFRQIPSVAGWNFWELVFVYALVFVTEGFVSICFEGLWRLDGLVHRGEFDLFLVRPVAPIVQTMIHDVGINGIGNVVLGAAMMVQALRHVAVDWTPVTAMIALVLFVSAVLVRGATVLAAAALGFWTGSPRNSAMQVVHSLASFAQFPLSIYGRGLQTLLTFGVPFAFVSYYPAAWLFSKEHLGWIGLFTPAVAVYSVFTARGIFMRGVRRYEGTGN